MITVSLGARRLIRPLFLFSLFFVILYVTFVVAWRDLSIGKDSATYADFFYNHLTINGYSGKFEPFFSEVTYWISLFFSNHQIYFFFLFSLLNIFLYVFYRYLSVYLELSRYLGVFSLLVFLLFSDWYFVAATNGLRQGLATPLLYCSCLLLLTGKYVRSLFFFVAACGFHYSVLLFLPFALFFRFSSERAFWVFWLVACLGYPSGINEIIVRLLSNLSGFGVYEKLSQYAADDPNWNGFQLNLYIYSLGYLAIFFAFKFVVSSVYIDRHMFLLRFYAFLLLPYFAFGFAAYSNRFAFYAWLFIPIFQSITLLHLRISSSAKIHIIAILFLISNIVFLTKLQIFL